LWFWPVTYGCYLYELVLSDLLVASEAVRTVVASGGIILHF